MSEPEARAWLIERAASEPTDVAGVTLRRGQVCASLREMAAAWGWSQATVRRRLRNWERDSIITIRTDTPKTIITICKHAAIVEGGGRRDTPDALTALRRRIAEQAGLTLGPEGVGERATLRGWLRLAAGDASRTVTAAVDAAAHAQAVIGPIDSLAPLHPWVEATLVDAAQPADVAQYAVAPGSIRRWAHKAPPGATLIYHVGDLASDRMTNPVTDATAILASALADLGAVQLLQVRTRQEGLTVYQLRRRAGYAQHPLVCGQCSPQEWRALAALSHRDADISATNTVRFLARLSADEARAAVAQLEAKGLIERITHRLTKRGAALLRDR